MPHHQLHLLRAQEVRGHCHGVCNLGCLQQHLPHPADCWLSAREPAGLSWVLLSSFLPALSHIHLPLSWGQDTLSLLLAPAFFPVAKTQTCDNSIEPQAGYARYGSSHETTSVKTSFSLQLIPNLQCWHAQSRAIQADFTPIVTHNQNASGASCVLKIISFPSCFL